jgi:DNA (cytosine-5)-methyltransferase 1
MIHIDLFSGIGGFALAVDTVWPGSEHIFCDNDKFCQQVIKKHWPKSKIYGDIRQFTPDAECERNRGEMGNGDGKEGPIQSGEKTPPTGIVEIRNGDTESRIDILTGGFPCQPFSQAGKRRGTEDDRYLWPEMLRVIREFHPRWVIGENVSGFVTWNDGMVLKQVCTDLEEAGYEVQPFVIPAVSVNAPHRRDRVWIVANCKSGGTRGSEPEGDSQWESKIQTGNRDCDVEDSIGERSGGGLEDSGQVLGSGRAETENARPNWEDNWLEVATQLCGVDDGLPVELDGFKLTKAGHRVQRLKALGNAIVPQVVIQILKVIKNYGGEKGI